MSYAEAEQALSDSDLIQALHRLETVAREHPNHPLGMTALYDIARIYEYQLHDQSAALAAYQRYLQLGPTAPLHVEAWRALKRLQHH